jgi:hypothetical protein
MELWGSIPDQDHVREWKKIGEADTLEELRQMKEKEIEFWRSTSNYFRLRLEGSFKVMKDGETIERDFR